MVWEDKPEDIADQCERELPVLVEDKSKEILSDPEKPTHYIFEGDKYHTLFTLNFTLEIYRAPDFIIDFYESMTNVRKVEIRDEVRKLANRYIDEKVVGKTSLADCQHIALATINNVDVLASWNFKHIVNLERIRGYNSIN